MKTNRPVVGRRVHVGATEVSHPIVVGVGIASGRVQVDGPTGHRWRIGGVRVGHRKMFDWEKKRNKLCPLLCISKTITGNQ